ncbi:MAG: MFS transporter [Thermoplasmatales archaeon]
MEGRSLGFDSRFKYLVANVGISRFGLASFNLIVIWIILYETKNAFLAGLGDGILSLPLFFSFIIGAFIDRSARKKAIAFLVSILRAVFLVTVLYGFYLDSLPIILLSIYASGFILGITSDVINSIRATWTKELLTEEQYKRGTSITSMANYIAEGAGYLLSGIILLLGFYHTFEALIAVFVVALIPLFFISTEFKPEEASAMQSMKDGITFIRQHKEIVQLMIIVLVLNITFGTIGIIFISLVQIKFHLPSIYASIVFSMFILGLIVGSFVANKIRGKLGVISMVIFFFTGALIALVSFLNSIFFVMIPAVVIGILVGIANVIYGASMLHIVSQEFMARISGAFNTFSVAATFSSGMLGGAIIQLTSVSDSFLVVGGFVMASVILWPFFREIYRITV